MALVKPKKQADTVEVPALPGLDALAADLASPEAARRRAAVRALGERPDGLPLLLSHLPRETAASVRSVLFTVLVERRSPEVAERLSGCLESEHVGLRNAAIEALQAMPEDADDTVAIRLSNPDSDVRIFAVNVLAITASERAPARLIEVLEQDDHINVCAAAIDGLTEIGSREAVPALEAAAARFSDSPFVVFAVSAALQRIRGR